MPPARAPAEVVSYRSTLLFSRERWLRTLSDAGFEPRALPFNHSELEPGPYRVFVAVRPA
jgi:hypothetical protein